VSNGTVTAMADPVVACPSCGIKNRVPVAATGHPRCPKCHTDLPWLVDASDADFATAVGTPTLVIVDLWAPWCGPCRMVAPTLERLSRDFAGRLKVVKVNVDESPLTAQRYQARSIPMLLFMRSGEVVNTVIGAQPEHVLRTLVEGELRVDG
jgi:thioredoxin 2